MSSFKTATQVVLVLSNAPLPTDVTVSGIVSVFNPLLENKLEDNNVKDFGKTTVYKFPQEVNIALPTDYKFPESFTVVKEVQNANAYSPIDITESAI